MLIWHLGREHAIWRLGFTWSEPVTQCPFQKLTLENIVWAYDLWHGCDSVSTCFFWPGWHSRERLWHMEQPNHSKTCYNVELSRSLRTSGFGSKVVLQKSSKCVFRSTAALLGKRMRVEVTKCPIPPRSKNPRLKCPLQSPVRQLAKVHQTSTGHTETQAWILCG